MAKIINMPKDVEPVHLRLFVTDEEYGMVAEGLWAYPVPNEEEVYIMGNIPSPGFPCLGDKFRLNEDGTFEIVEKISHSHCFRYDIEGCNTHEEVVSRFKPFCEYLQNHGIEVEGFCVGVAGIAIPVSITDEEFENILVDCPFLIIPEDDEDEE